MTKVVTKTPRKTPRKTRIKDVSKKSPAVSQQEVASAFGAIKIGTATDKNSPPWALAYVGKQIEQRLCSTGGRPALEGADKKIKVPVTAEDMARIEYFSRRFPKVAKSQIASVLLHMAAQELPEQDIEEKLEAVA